MPVYTAARSAASSRTSTATGSSTSARASPSPRSATRRPARRLGGGEQVADFTHTCFMITPYEEYVAVAEQLNRLTPGSVEKRSALFNSGSEAVENAIKIARTYTRKPAVVSFDHAYHGRTNLTMALTAKSMPYKHGFGPFAPEIYRAPLSYPFRDAEFGKEMATDGEVAATSRDQRDRQAGRRRQPGRGDHRTHPGRGRLHRAGGRLPARAAGLVPRKTTSCSSPTRCRPGSPAPARCSHANTRASSRI